MDDLHDEVFQAIEEGTLDSLGTATKNVMAVLASRRYVKASDLMGLGDIANFFDVGISTAGNWRDRQSFNGMPDPVAKLTSGPVWDGQEVLEWWKAWKPRKRGGPKAGSLPWDRETADA